MDNIFWTTFWLIFVTEIADKSRLAGLILVSAYRAPWQIFAGMTLGYLLLEGIAVLIGRFLPTFIPMFWIQVCVATLFIIIGLATWFIGEEMEDHAKKWVTRVEHWGAFLVSFVMISLSEIGDRTQVAVSALSAQTEKPLAVYVGAVSALAILNVLTVWLGDRLVKCFPQKLVRRFAALIFVLVGCAMFGHLFWGLARNR